VYSQTPILGWPFQGPKGGPENPSGPRGERKPCIHKPPYGPRAQRGAGGASPPRLRGAMDLGSLFAELKRRGAPARASSCKCYVLQLQTPGMQAPQPWSPTDKWYVGLEEHAARTKYQKALGKGSRAFAPGESVTWDAVPGAIKHWHAQGYRLLRPAMVVEGPLGLEDFLTHALEQARRGARRLRARSAATVLQGLAPRSLGPRLAPRGAEPGPGAWAGRPGPWVTGCRAGGCHRPRLHSRVGARLSAPAAASPNLGRPKGASP